MNKKLIISLSVVYMSLCNILFANYTISGTVQSEDGDPIKKGLITLVKESNGEEVDKTKVSRKGKFKLKKISSGKYIINFTGDKIKSKPVSVMDDDVEDFIIAIKTVEEPQEQLSQETEILNKPNMQTLNTPLKTENKNDLLPQLRPYDQVDRLDFEDQFFELSLIHI